MTQQPEALRLADRLDLYATGDKHQKDIEDAAAELRRLQSMETESKERILRLEGALTKEVAINAQLLEALTKQEPDAYGYASRLAVAIWEQHYKGVAPQWKPLDDLMGVLTQIDNMTAGLTAQRQPQYNKTEMNCFVQNLYDQKMREGKHGHYETMFHVVHRAIEAAYGITGEKK